jgi:signal transduction histidine kinase/CheY-like chemotaxis protein
LTKQPQLQARLRWVHLPQVLFASFVLGGMVSGAMGSLSVFTPAYLAFAFPAVLPFAVGCFLSGNVVFTGFGFLTSVFALVSLGYGVGLNRTVRHSIELRFANAQLLLDLQAERDLARRGDADKTALLAAATHDLRQPAYAAGLYASSLRHLLMNSSPQVQHVSERLSASIDAFNGLLEGLLDLAQLDAGAQLPPPLPIEINQLLESVAAALAATAAQYGVTIRVRVSRPLANPMVLAPYDALHRVLLNLTSNAIKFTDGRQVLLFARCVSVSAGGSRLVRIGVADAGPGIATADQQQLFKAFERLPHTHSKPGLGLGLAIVKRLSEQMHAPIALHSAIGRGSCFSLEVPINNEDIQMRQLPVTVQTSAIQAMVVPNNKAGLAWVVDDDLQALAATEHALSQLGLQTRGFTDAQSVLDALTACLPENRPCIVVTDLHLGAHSPIDGLALAQRARSAVPAIAALVITGETAPSHLQQIATSGVPVLRKPCKSDALRDMVLGLL